MISDQKAKLAQKLKEAAELRKKKQLAAEEAKAAAKKAAQDKEMKETSGKLAKAQAQKVAEEKAAVLAEKLMQEQMLIEQKEQEDLRI